MIACWGRRERGSVPAEFRASLYPNPPCHRFSLRDEHHSGPIKPIGDNNTIHDRPVAIDDNISSVLTPDLYIYIYI